MINIFKDIVQILSSLSIVDYVLYFAVIVLIILIVSLIYIIETEKEENVEEIKEEENNKELPMNIEKDGDIDLQSIINAIEESPKPTIDLTAYEEEQENNAIISYDELVNGVKQKEIYYTKEEMVDDVIPVKKITLDTPKEPVVNIRNFEITPGEPKIPYSSEEKSDVEEKIFAYEKEEAFLKALKQLNELLN